MKAAINAAPFAIPSTINRLPTEPKFSRHGCNPCAVCGLGAEFAYLLIGQDGLPADIFVPACLLAMELPPAGAPDLTFKLSSRRDDAGISPPVLYCRAKVEVRSGI